jgi:hypothetical protein
MFVDFCYYFIYTGFIGATCFGSYYCYDPENANDILMDISWKSLNLYFSTKTYVNKFLDKDVNKKKSTNVKTNPLETYIIFNKENNSISHKENLDHLEKLDLSNYLYFLVKDDNTFLRLDNNTFNVKNNDLIPVEKQFIQVELNVGDINIDINSYLKHYYCKENKILDQSFLLWLREYYLLQHIPVEYIKNNDYTIKIIDKNVEMFDISPTQYIVFNEKDKYKIVSETISEVAPETTFETTSE